MLKPFQSSIPGKELLPKLLQQVETLSDKRILVVGDCGLDEYITGDVRRISPEAPVPVLEVKKEDTRLGMAANVAHNIVGLGGYPILVSVIGKDQGADKLRDILEREGIEGQYLVEDSCRPTTRKARVMTGHNHIVRVDYERRQDISESVHRKILQVIKDNIDQCQAVVLQDYAKGLLNETLIQEILLIAKSSSKQVLIDPHRETPLDFYRGANLFKPNFEESLTLLGESFDRCWQDEQAILNLGQRIRDKIGADELVLTRGSEGMVLYSAEQVNIVPTYARQVFDVTGAGDTVVATLALAKAAQLSLLDSCVLSNFAAGFVVGKVGCVPCSGGGLKAYIENLTSGR